jgi:hypothetical protein
MPRARYNCVRKNAAGTWDATGAQERSAAGPLVETLRKGKSSPAGSERPLRIGSRGVISGLGEW